ncbi:MAG: RHS repeat protein, partial [Thiotrichaceae bacterium]|nr:RHS repeat protein [Thiotrichaceae bacterium]
MTDELGNVLTATDRNGAVVRTRYDSLNRVIQAEYLSDATTQAAQYNQYGELDLISNEAVTYSYAYDNQQRMTRKTDSRNGLRLDWGYNEIGRVVSKFDYQNVATKFTYDNTGRLIAMANKDYVQASYHYDAAGRLLSRILSNGAATLYNYDKDGFLTKITQRSSSGDIIDERSYTQDSVGNITQVAITGGDTTDYLYDPAYRLTQVNASDVTNNQTFSYDAVGNRLSKTHNGVINNYTYSAGNRLDELRHGTALVFSYDYDDNGSRINKRNSAGAVVESYQYNQKCLITQMNSAGSVTDFAYDPNLYRIQKSSSAGTNHYLLEAEHLE